MAEGDAEDVGGADVFDVVAAVDDGAEVVFETDAADGDHSG